MLGRSRTTRVTALGCVVLVGSLLVPGTSAADPVAPPRPTIAATGAAIAARHVAAFSEARVAQPQTPPAATQPDLQSGSFFKTKAGVAVLAAFGAGVGYALYSVSNDRIKSPGR
jgi:drug/metabolite transporter (DMT)-like permease